MKQWYKMTVYRGHAAHSHAHDTPVYIFESSTMRAYNRFKYKMPGLKFKPNSDPHNKPRHCRFPDIMPLSKEEGERLEEKIKKEGRVNLTWAKRTWYYEFR
ncbi:MAG: hypothetical protein V1645_04665 [archaeon]